MNAIAHASALPASGPKLDNRRVLAALIDLVVLAAGGALIVFAAGALNGGEAEFTPALDVILLAWALYYYFACESGGGQTIGKRVMRLRVVRADGGHAGMGEIFVRTILRVIDGIAFYLVGLVVMLVTGKRRQRLGDLAAGTVVVDAAASGAPVAPAGAPAAPPAEPAPVEMPQARAVTMPEVPQGHQLSEPPATAVPVPELRPFEPATEPERDVQPDPGPEIEVEPEPAAEVEPEVQPVMEVEPDLEVEPEPALEVEPEPAAEVEPEPAVEVADEPAQDPVPVPIERHLPGAADAETEESVVVRSVETVSAIDLVMGNDEQDPGPGEPDAQPQEPDR
jgi:uncharacterized RDD family membrane protein YckC